MADNTILNPGVGGDTIATDDIAGVKHQLVKLEYGVAGEANPVSSSNQLPVSSYQAGTWTVTASGLATSSLALEAGNLATIATSLGVIDDWDETDRAKVNPIVGQAGVQGGSGAVTALTQRVVLATDVAMPAGTNFLGSVSTYQIGSWSVTATGLATSSLDRKS